MSWHNENAYNGHAYFYLFFLSAADLECGRVGYYCPQGSFYPLLVGGGNYSIGGSAHNRTRTAQVICPPGSYCANSIPVLCPMGRYGSTAGLKDSACTGKIYCVLPLCLCGYVLNNLSCHFDIWLNVQFFHTFSRSVSCWFLLSRRHCQPHSLPTYRVFHRTRFLVQCMPRWSHHAAALSNRKELL